jgi:hypothetical protein
MAIDPQKISSAFADLPANIKSWLASEELTYTIGEINNRVGLQEEKRSIIPNLILRLTVRDLEPLNFINELAEELGVNFEVAKTIAKDIEARALRPIENELKRDLGLDVKIIYFGKPGGKPPQEEKSTQKDSEIYIPKEPTAAPTQEAEKPTQIGQVSEPKVDLKTFEEISPFMLHQEKSELGQRTPSEAGPRINIRTPLSQTRPEEEFKPISVKLESPRTDNIPQQVTPKISAPQESSNNKTRVVHYHQFKTPVNNLGLPKRDNNQ